MKALHLILAMLVIALALPTSVQARRRPPGPTPDSGEPSELKIVEADAVSVTVTVGKSGDQHFTYKVTDSTKVTLNGAPAFARDLKPGMVAKFTLTPDHATAITIEAKDPPANPARHRVG
ncbi:MAG TPA: hypothetical protein VGM54_05325 [Chthoniobacter sp.]|jgi:hypothetical protein